MDASGHSAIYLCGSSGSRSRPSHRSVYCDQGNAAEQDGQQGHDTFKDVDGTAWLVHSSDWNKTLRLSRLTEDFTDVDGFYASALTDQTREAPALMYRDGKYYMITSGCTGWQPNSALYAECDHLCGQWKLIDNPCEGDNYRRTFEGQSTYIFERDGKTYLMLDHWHPEDLKSSGYSILPVEVVEGILSVIWQENFCG